MEDISDYKQPNRKPNHDNKSSLSKTLSDIATLAKFISKQLRDGYKADKADVKNQMNKDGIHNLHDLISFIKKVFNEFPKPAKKLIKAGLRISLVVFVLFTLIGIITLSFSKIMLGLLLGVVGVIATDVIAIRTYPIITKTFWN